VSYLALRYLTGTLSEVPLVSGTTGRGIVKVPPCLLQALSSCDDRAVLVTGTNSDSGTTALGTGTTGHAGTAIREMQ